MVDKHVYEETEVIRAEEVEPQPVEPVVVDPQPEPQPQVQKEPVPWFSREPVLVMGAVQTALALAMGFGFDIDLTQMGLIMAFVAAILSLVTRQQVTPFVPAGTTPNVENPQNTPNVG